jgi:hypothetical protein
MSEERTSMGLPEKESKIVQHTKRPYAPPRLRRLGSVRELTLGASMGMIELVGGRKMR